MSHEFLIKMVNVCLFSKAINCVNLNPYLEYGSNLGPDPQQKTIDQEINQINDYRPSV